jgi:hypothetical protein
MSRGINYFRYGWRALPWKKFQRTVEKQKSESIKPPVVTMSGKYDSYRDC